MKAISLVVISIFLSGCANLQFLHQAARGSPMEQRWDKSEIGAQELKE